MSKKILLAGESWFVYEVHVKGFDTFTNSTYGSGEKWLVNALEQQGYEVTFMPNHIARNEFPFTVEEMNEYDTVILSDIGASTLLLPEATFSQSKVLPNRCNVLRDYVKAGGSLLMVGGYMTFSGIDAKGKWHDTAVQEVLPVEVLTVDDRMEHSEGVRGEIVLDHDVVNGIQGEWPVLLGYNKTILKENATEIVKVNNDPLVAICEYEKGRTAVFTSDCAPHWAPEEFCAWEGYERLFGNLVKWLTKA